MTNNRQLAFRLVIIVLIIILVVVFYKPTKNKDMDIPQMNITSSAFSPNSDIPTKYTCEGAELSPPLAFGDVPKEAKSLALILSDPDAPSGTFVHWVRFNIAVETKILNEGTEPSGDGGLNSDGTTVYLSPCPPSGTHHYIFEIYALDIKLSPVSPPDKKALENLMAGHILASGKLVGLYSAKK